MTAIISILGAGSTSSARPLAVLGKGSVKRIRAGVASQFALAEPTGAAADLLVKRVGENLHVAEKAQGTEHEVLIVDAFFAGNSQLFGLDADGNYQPYLVLTDVGGLEVSKLVERESAFLNLAVAGPVIAAEATVSPDLVPGVAAVAPPHVQVVPANAQERVAHTSSHVIHTSAPDEDTKVLAAVESRTGHAVVWGGSGLPDVAAEPIEKQTLVDTTAVVPFELSTAQQDNINEARSDAIVTVQVETAAPGAAVAGAADSVPVIDALWDDHGAVTGIIQNGGVTDDGRPKIMGKAEPGVVVHVYDGIELIGNTVADANGDWSFIPRYPMADGQHVVSIVHEYPNGDVSEDSAPYIIIVDKVVPDIPVITGMTDDQGRITGQIATGSAIDDNRPTIDGEAEPYSTVIIYDKGNQIGSALVDGDGKWRYTPDVALADGLHILEYAAVDRAGNLSEKSRPIEFLVDTRPELVEIYAADDDVGVVTGAFMSGGVTDDTQPRLFGTATAGGIVKIYEGTTLLGQVTAGVDGKWEFTPPLALSEGMHSLSATVSTEAKGESEHSPAFELTIDTSAPDKPTIEQVYDDVGQPRGPLAQGQSTDDSTPTLSGKAEAGSTVRIYDHGKLLGTTLADASGNWSYTVTPALDDGEHLFSVTAQDKAGSVSEASDGFAIVIDTVPAAPPVIELVYDDQGGQTGYLNSGDITDDSKPTISGSAEAFAKVVVRDHGLEIGHAMADADGMWSFEPFLPMGLGPHKLTAEAIDAAGNISAPSNRFDLILGSPDLPAVPAITSVVDDMGLVTGNLQKNDVTDDARPTINGTAQAGMTISVYVDGKLAGSTLVGGNGEWSYTLEADLVDGPHKITAKAINSVGNASEPTGEYPIIVDTTPPVAPVEADAALWDDAGQITGQISNGTVTDDNTPTFVGRAEPNATVVIYDGGAVIGRVPTNASGDWSFTPSPVLADGPHTFAYEVVDKAGNVGPKSSVISFEVTTKGVVVSIDGATDDAGAVTGEIGKNGVTDDTTPTLYGVATVGGTVNVYEGATLLGQAVAGSDGKWSFTLPVGLSEGQHSLSATVSTAANGESAPSEMFAFTIDLTAPVKPTIDQIDDDVGFPRGPLSQGQSTDDTTPTLSGKAEAGSTVRIYDGGSLLGAVTADPSGNWNFTPSPPLLNGAHDFAVTAEDKAGNLSAKSDVFGIVIDTVAPNAPVIVSVVDDQGNQTGLLNSGDATDDTKPTLSGTAEPNSTVIVRDDGHEIGRAVAGPDGKWTLEPVLPMGLGEHKLTAEAVDAAGNVSAPSNPFDLILGSPDQPSAPAITSVIDDTGSITGNIQKDGVTDDARPTINGTAQAGMTVSIYIDGVHAGTIIAKPNGDWSFTPSADLADGLHEITATATNTLGNISPETGKYPIVVDTTPPEVPAPADATLWDDAGTITGVITSGTITDDNTPTFNGVAEPNATVIIYDDGEEIGRVVTNAAGAWSFTPSPVLVDGAHKLNYEVVDKAGNIGPKSETIEFTVDTSKLEVSIDGAIDDVGGITGAISKGGVTDDTMPTLHGKATPGGTVKIYEGGVLLGQAIAGSDGQWSVTVPEAMGGGAHSLTATVTTVANGESDPSSAFDFNIDITAPDIPTIVEVKDDVGFPQNALSKGESTDDTTPTLSGKAEAGSTVYVYDKGSLLGSVVAGGAGDWSFTPNPPLLNGTHEFTVKAEDKAGNVSQPSDVFDIIIDTVAPEKPLIDSVYDDQGARTGDVLAGAGTDDAQPRISGRAEAGSTVIIKDGDAELGRVLAGSDGKWVFDPPVALSEGAHALSVEAMDAAGNVSAPSDEFGFMVDTSLPTTPRILNLNDRVGSFKGLIKNGGSTDDTRPIINGNGKADEAIEIYLDGALLGTTVVGENGRWAFTPEVALVDGHYGLTALAISAGGAESAASNLFQVNVDTVAPDRPVVEDVLDNAGTWTGSLQNGAVTDDRTPTFKGKAEPGTTILVFDNGDEVGFASVGADGSWSYSTEVLGFGEHRITFHSVDVAANLSPASEAWVLVVTMPSRSLGAEVVAETMLPMGGLLLDGYADIFAEDAGQLEVAASSEPVGDLSADGDVGEQESWTASINPLEVRADWSVAGMMDASQMLDQQLS